MATTSSHQTTGLKQQGTVKESDALVLKLHFAVPSAVKDQSVVSKLISSPSDGPRGYICDDCINVCRSIIEDERGDLEPDTSDDETLGDRKLCSISRWRGEGICRDRSTAIRLIQQSK